jgi:hypothetical protein
VLKSRSPAKADVDTAAAASNATPRNFLFNMVFPLAAARIGINPLASDFTINVREKSATPYTHAYKAAILVMACNN